jgi:hypothetical protein
MFGQMIALLELPPHIAPLLFCWSAGVVRFAGRKGTGRCRGAGARPSLGRELTAEWGAHGLSCMPHIHPPHSASASNALTR